MQSVAEDELSFFLYRRPDPSLNIRPQWCQGRYLTAALNGFEVK